MTKKDFELIARVLCLRHLHLQYSKRRAIANAFADELERTNARFDRERFVAACTKEI